MSVLRWLVYILSALVSNLQSFFARDFHRSLLGLRSKVVDCLHLECPWFSFRVTTADS